MTTSYEQKLAFQRAVADFSRKETELEARLEESERLRGKLATEILDLQTQVKHLRKYRDAMEAWVAELLLGA